MAPKTLYPATTPEPLNIPSGASVRVSIIDNGARIKAPTAPFMAPPMHGHTHTNSPAYSFLISQPSSSRKILFDAGIRKDVQSFPPTIQELISGPDWAFNDYKNVDEVLQESGVDVKGGGIEAVIWSHWHFDHTGDMSQFSASTSLITGAGVRNAFFPPYPEGEKSPLLASDFEGREHRELDFDGASKFEIGGLRAIDFFGDGSFYLLDAPGHAIGHICGLARVTSTSEGDAEDTFIFMGGDTAHHGAEFRPTEFLPLPEQIEPSPYVARYPSICPGHVFEAVHRDEKGVLPFYDIGQDIAHDIKDAMKSNDKMKVFDAAENVLVVIAHDATLLDKTSGLEWFPHGTLKNWKQAGVAERVRWTFLRDFVPAVEHGAE